MRYTKYFIPTLKDSPADKAGLLPGDIVISIDGKKIRNANDVRNRIGLLPVGEKSSLSYYVTVKSLSSLY